MWVGLNVARVNRGGGAQCRESSMLGELNVGEG